MKNMSDNQKINFIKTTLCKESISTALDKLLKDEDKKLNIIRLILDCLDDESVSKYIVENNSIKKSDLKLFTYSKILGVLHFYNKNNIIKSLFKKLNHEVLSDILNFEKNNNTTVFLENKVVKKYFTKFNKKQNKTSKVKFIVIFSLILIILFSLVFIININIELSKYKGKFYPNIYLNEIDLSNKKLSELTNVINNEKQKLLNQKITFVNTNNEYIFSFEELNITIDSKKTYNDINNYISNLGFFDKINLIRKKNKKTFYLETNITVNDINNIVEILSQKTNTDKKDDALIVDQNYNVYYDKGINGFKLDEENTKEVLKKSLSSLTKSKIIIKGNVIKKVVKYEHLSSINKKISSYTTYFVNSGNRGHNITLASSKLNGTVLKPGEEFSYLKVVGPYGYSNGYRPAPIYINGELSTANGGGVCQLASTLYNAQLRAGLITVFRRNHSIAPTYVPKGLDATVYSTTTNYKFKNNHTYPVYIVSYVKGNYLTVDIWSNEKALNGKTYEPYSIYSNGGYLSYLKVIENGKVIETKYLDKSYYKK